MSTVEASEKCKYVWNTILGLLYWSMLAACTVGPGTVVTCARAGAEQDLRLIWCLVFASLLAFVLQEGSARLTILSGKSLGQCIRIKYKGALSCFCDTAAICWIVSFAVIIGNTFYEANNFAGGMNAVYALPNVDSDLTTRLIGCAAYAAVVSVLLYFDKTEILGQGLGILMVVMIGLFLIIVCITGFDVLLFLHGLIPNFPSGSASLIISLVGTTSIGFNLFLGSSMATGRPLKATRYGIAFSTILALIVSVLILIVGSGIGNNGEKKAFSIKLIGDTVKLQTGTVGVIIYALGFIAAAISSMLTVPLGAALTVKSVFTDPKAVIDLPGVTVEESSQRELPHWIYVSIQMVMVAISAIVIASGLRGEDVIQYAQVINGCILPFFSVLLLLCINDPQFLGGDDKQSLTSNVLMILSTTVTISLASNVILKVFFGQFIAVEEIRVGIAFVIGVVIMILLLIFTGLRVQVFRKYPNSMTCKK